MINLDEAQDIVIGIDAAFAKTGYAVLRGDDLRGYGTIETKRGTLNAENTLGADNQRRIFELHCKIGSVISQYKHNGDPLHIAYEVTDWQPGSAASRTMLVRDAIARGALWMGATVVMLTCQQYGISPLPIGANEWMEEFGSNSKFSTARLVSAQFPSRFVFEAIEAMGAVEPDDKYTLIDAGYAPERKIPDHVSDAVAIAFVAQKRIVRARKIAQARAIIEGVTQVHAVGQ